MLGDTETPWAVSSMCCKWSVCVGVRADDIITNYWNNFLPPVLLLLRAKVQYIVMKLLKELLQNWQLMRQTDVLSSASSDAHNI